MKKDGKYRFSLQFGADSEEQVKAGELLERLGNKKVQLLLQPLTIILILTRICRIHIVK